MNAEHFLAGIWLPICHFSPVIFFLGIVTSVFSSMLGGGNIPLVCTKFLSFILGGIISGMIFGFHFSSEITLATNFWMGFSILGGTFITSYLFVKTNTMIVLTREKVKEQKAKLDKELEEAAAYVKSMLPSPIHEGPVYIDWCFVPSASLGGDAFGYNQLDNDHFAIYLLDVSGHGVGATLLSVTVLNVLRSQSLANTDFKRPNQVLNNLNLAFQGEKHNDMFFTFWYGVTV